MTATKIRTTPRTDAGAPARSGDRSALVAFTAAFWPFAAALVLLCVFGFDVDAGRRYWPRQQILDAIRQVESGGREKPPDGDGGRAIGPFQIHAVYWVDASGDKTLGGTYEQCRQRDYAERVVTAYMRRHAATAWERGDAQTIARIHNGGPKGAESPKTLDYWRRVRQQLPR